ncbi:unnamed protein product, partial [Mesorhabditis spiculigera]
MWSAIFLTLFLWPHLSIDALQSPWRQRSPDDWNGIPFELFVDDDDPEASAIGMEWNMPELGFDGITDPFAKNAANPVYEFDYGDFGDQPPAEQARKSPTPERRPPSPDELVEVKPSGTRRRHRKALSEFVTRSDSPSTDPDHKKKNDAALRENLKLRQYTGVLNSWSTDLDGFHKFAIEKGRTQLMPFLANNLVDRQLLDKLRKQLERHPEVMDFNEFQDTALYRRLRKQGHDPAAMKMIFDSVPQHVREEGTANFKILNTVLSGPVPARRAGRQKAIRKAVQRITSRKV